jgi:FAD/FMN-containing dehydrogenase
VSDLASPLQQSHRFYVLLEFRDSQAAAGSERFESALFELLEDKKMDDAVIAQSHQEAANFWRIRDGVAELLKSLGPLSNQDISLPISKIGEFTEVLQARLTRDYDNMEVLLFGHLGDNNIHALAYTGRQCDVEPINSQIMHMIGEFGGAITAEHGVGVLKKKYLPLSRSASEIDLMKTLKSAMDPRNILNPGRVI